eukprot:523743-Prorocentrum_minimum.AAC.5
MQGPQHPQQTSNQVVQYVDEEGTGYFSSYCTSYTSDIQDPRELGSLRVSLAESGTQQDVSVVGFFLVWV